MKDKKITEKKQTKTDFLDDVFNAGDKIIDAGSKTVEKIKTKSEKNEK